MGAGSATVEASVEVFTSSDGIVKDGIEQKESERYLAVGMGGYASAIWQNGQGSSVEYCGSPISVKFG